MCEEGFGLLTSNPSIYLYSTSIRKAKPVKFSNERRLELGTHLLLECVCVELRIPSPKLVRLLFIIVLLQVGDEFWGHVGVVWARSDRRKHIRSHIPVTNLCDDPAWADDAEEKTRNKEPTCLASLDLD